MKVLYMGALLLLGWLATGCGSEADEAKVLAAAEFQGKWGWIDRQGNWVIQPQFPVPSQFNEGLVFMVKSEEIDTTDLTAPRGIRYGYLGTDGKWAVQPQFQLAFPHSEGLALVRDGEKLMFVDKTGKAVLRTDWQFAMHFSEGLVAVGKTPKGKRGFINPEGRVVVPLKYDKVKPFHNGLAMVVRADSTAKGVEYFWGVVNTEGKEVLPLRYKGLGPQFRQGLTRFSEEGKFGFIDMKGEVIFKPAYLFAHGFRKDRAPVLGYDTQREPKWGLIDKNGRQVVDFVFDFIDTRGYAAHNRILVGRVVGDQRRYGYIDGDGKVIVPLMFPLADIYSEGLALVQDEQTGLWGYIDPDGNWKIRPTFSRATHFVNTHHNYLTDEDYLRDE
ncbi:MAG: WG repeat-containing protein [Bacteroidetes bacterium]|nr:WG repeat-containing protein [Bacteroidota bacterium]